MDSTGLVETFRSEIVDTTKPYLWSDTEVLRYANEAYRMFVRLTGGISDFTSDACTVDIVAGEPLADLHPSVMRVMSATRRSDTHPLQILNSTDLSKMRSSDYGQMKQLVMDDKTGPVRYMMLGMQRGVVRWIQVPEVADTVDLHVYRLPLDQITDFGQELSEVDEDHHFKLVDWMKHLAYKKPDLDGFNPKGSEQCKRDFENYCAFVRAEWERYKHKTRVVSYGGL